MYCLKCGEELKPGDKFCTKCGTAPSAPAPKPTPSENPNKANPNQQTISCLLLERGNSFYQKGKIFLRILFGGLGLLAAVLLIAAMIGGDILYCLAVHSHYGFVDFLVVISYLAILIGGVAGPVLYLSGLHYLGLGQITKNTDR